MKNPVNRRDFFKRIGLGTIGLGFGVSIFDGIYAYAETQEEDEKHRKGPNRRRGCLKSDKGRGQSRRPLPENA